VTGRVVAVVGPTATGKSTLAVALAHVVGGEVVNADSMQLYQGMDIGTAKPTASERGGVPHHMLDLWHVTRAASVAEYQRSARSCLDDLLAAGITPIVVGGSGLYVRAALDRLEFPGTDPVLRAELEAELERRGPAELHARLNAVDPAAAAAILSSNGRRIVRALEVVALTGRPFSATLPSYDAAYDVVTIGLDVADAELDVRVRRRAEAMFAAGLLDEVRGLERIGLRHGRTARSALGYRQCLAVLDGAMTEREALETTIRLTCRFVRRQRSWFRRDPRITWLDASTANVTDALDRLARS
jgi:tRNA dimethylallyltransferase